jgi:hypothetical protein
MSADRNPTTLPPLTAEHDSKIAGRNAAQRAVDNPGFSSERRSLERFQMLEVFRRENFTTRCDLRGLLVVDCNGWMKFFAGHCDRR